MHRDWWYRNYWTDKYSTKCWTFAMALTVNTAIQSFQWTLITRIFQDMPSPQKWLKNHMTRLAFNAVNIIGPIIFMAKQTSSGKTSELKVQTFPRFSKCWREQFSIICGQEECQTTEMLVELGNCLQLLPLHHLLCRVLWQIFQITNTFAQLVCV